MIGLKFLLTGGQFFIAFLSQEFAATILNKYLTGEYELKGPSRIGSIQREASWVLDVKNIIGIHTVTREELMGQAPAQTPPMTSGVTTPLQPWKP